MTGFICTRRPEKVYVWPQFNSKSLEAPHKKACHTGAHVVTTYAYTRLSPTAQRAPTQANSQTPAVGICRCSLVQFFGIGSGLNCMLLGLEW